MQTLDPMRSLFTLLLLALPLMCAAEDDVVVPEGFVLQPLSETDGQIARPKDWFYSSNGTPSGWLWTISKEDPTKGPYKTGLRIQLLVGVAEGTGRTREDFVRNFISGKRATSEITRTCPASDFGQFYRQCIEVLEPVQPPAGPGTYRILYSLMWGKALDMVVVSTFGAPPEIWHTVAPIADTMTAFRLIGPNFGK
jgi:hypothetical protein